MQIILDENSTGISTEYLFMEDFENAKSNFIKCLNYDDSDYSALYNIVYCFEILEQNKTPRGHRPRGVSFIAYRTCLLQNDHLNSRSLSRTYA